MSATKSARAHRSAKPVSPVAPSPVSPDSALDVVVGAAPVADLPSAPVADLPSAPVSPVAPTIQEIISAPGPISAPVGAVKTGPHAESARLYGESLARFGDNLDSDIKGTVASFNRNGLELLRGIDAKILPSTTEAERNANRAAAVKGADLLAQIRYNAAGENPPKLSRMINVAVVCRMFPAALDLANPGQIEAIFATVTRDYPKSWNGPESYSVKPQYCPVAVADLISRAVADNLGIPSIKAEIERIGGVVEPIAPKPPTLDPIGKGKTAADSVWESIANRDNPEKPGIDAYSFFARFVELAHSRGFEIAPTHDAQGAPTQKLVKITR